MTRSEAIELYEFLAATYPRQYRGLTDKELSYVVDSLAHTFRFVTFAEVRQEYLNAFSRNKTAPHPSEILQALTPTEKDSHATLDHDEVYQRLQQLPEYKKLVQSYGGDKKAECKVKRQAKIAIQTGTFDELLFRLTRDQ